MDKIVLESRNEVALLWNVADAAFHSDDCSSEEKEAAKRLSELLESMYYSW
jgi:hypothetical protein